MKKKGREKFVIIILIVLTLIILLPFPYVSFGIFMFAGVVIGYLVHLVNWTTEWMLALPKLIWFWASILVTYLIFFRKSFLTHRVWYLTCAIALPMFALLYVGLGWYVIALISDEVAPAYDVFPGNWWEPMSTSYE